MSVKAPNENLSLDIKDFIQLLQRNQANAQKRRRQSLDSDKLSIIYSASQPQSSLADKQNSHNSINNKSLTAEENCEIDFFFKEIKKIGLTSEQLSYIQKLQLITCQLKKNMITCQSRLKQMQQQFQQQKQGTDEILKALIKMDSTQKQLLSNYSQLSNRYLKLQDEYQVLSNENDNLKRYLNEGHQDIEFMKKLVLVANQNYQNIQRKCKNMEKNKKKFQRFKQQKSSPEITSRSQFAFKKSPRSPSISQRSNVLANKGYFEENYRKLILKTLKSKVIR